MGAPGVPKMGYFDGRVPKLNVNVNVTLGGRRGLSYNKKGGHTYRQTD